MEQKEQKERFLGKVLKKWIWTFIFVQNEESK